MAIHWLPAGITGTTTPMCRQREHLAAACADAMSSRGVLQKQRGRGPLRDLAPFCPNFRRTGVGHLSPASRCRRRPRPESLRPRSPSAFRHRSPARAFPPSIETCGCPQISRNSGCPLFRGSSGRPALPEIRFRSFGDAGCPVPPQIRRSACNSGCPWLPAGRCRFFVGFGCPLPSPPRFGSPWTSVSRRPWHAARFRVRLSFPRRPAPRSEAPEVPVARPSLNLVRPS
jgi:hypothetical protein